MAKTETAKAETRPTISTEISKAEKDIPNLTSFKALAPNITGTARKNVYSAAAALETPRSKAPTIVAPLLEVPGKTAAMS